MLCPLCFVLLLHASRLRRKRAAEERNTKLKSPNFVISRTRLSVRNIPPSWGETQLKGLFVKAVKQRATQAEPNVRSVSSIEHVHRTWQPV